MTPEQTLPRLAARPPDTRHLFGQKAMLRPLETAIAIEQANGLAAGQLQKSYIREPSHAQIRQAALLSAKELTGPSQPEILLGQQEAIAGSLDDPQTLPYFKGRGL